MGEDGQVLSGNRPGPADPNQKRAGTGRGDAAGASQTVPVGACRDFPILARVGGPPAGMGENGQVLSGNRPGPADPNQKRAGTGRGDAAGASQTVPARF